MPLPDNAPISCRFHESRINELEENVKSISMEIAKHAERIGFVSAQVESLPEKIEEKIGVSLAMATKSIEKQGESLQEISDTVKSMVFERGEAKKKFDFLKSIITSAILAAAGALGVKLLEIWTK